MARRANEQATMVARREVELSPAKREQIVRGARATFSELGYERASVDAIATRAGVSKATIYNHFRDKQALFIAILSEETADLRAQFHQVMEAPTGDVEADLRRIGRHLLRLACAPDDVRRMRVVTAEAARFPELGKELYAGSMLVGRERMVHFFRSAHAAGQLELDDPADAAKDFAGLLLHDLCLKLQLGVISRVGKELLEQNVERAVGTFLRAYRPRSDRRGARPKVDRSGSP